MKLEAEYPPTLVKEAALPEMPESMATTYLTHTDMVV
jgi:hypothetical protein